jgi:hypothetical protein
MDSSMLKNMALAIFLSRATLRLLYLFGHDQEQSKIPPEII